MWRIVQHDEPEDFVLATGKTQTVRSFVEAAFRHVGTDIEWNGTGVDEVGTEKATGRLLVRVDPRYFRPTEVDHLIGDPRKAREKLGWNATTTLSELISEMVQADLEQVAEQHRRNRHE